MVVYQKVVVFSTMADGNGSRIQRWVLHTSDLHFRRLGDRVSHCLEAIIDLAIKTKVDLVIVAGDLFDCNRVGDNLVSFVIEQLERLSVPTFSLPGNYDSLVSDSVYHRVELWKDVNNIRVFRAPQGETLTLPGLSVWGRPITSHDGDEPSWASPQDTVNIVDFIEGIRVQVSRCPLQEGAEK